MGEGAKRPEARCYPDLTGVDAAGRWGESHASYPGRSVCLPCASCTERCGEGQAEVSRGRISCQRTAVKGRTRGAEPVRSV